MENLFITGLFLLIVCNVLINAPFFSNTNFLYDNEIS